MPVVLSTKFCTYYNLETNKTSEQAILKKELFYFKSKTDPKFHIIPCAALREVRDKDVRALIGPFMHAYSVVCEQLRVPYLVTSQMPGDSHDVEENAFLIELFPSKTIFTRAVLDVLHFYSFGKKVALIYDSEAGVIYQVTVVYI
jgi:hypothetical protein